jgi:MFS family permease
MEGSHEFRQHWRALAGCTIAASIGTIGLHAYTSGAFAHALTTDAGFTRDQMSLATLILSASVAICAPFAGVLMDRFGALRIVTIAVFGEALAFALLGLIPDQFMFYAAGMMVLAVMGVGTTPPGFARMVTARFDRSRGLALGVMISGLGLMAISGPIWATWVIEHFGWRGGYLVLASLVLVLGGIGVLLIRSEGAAHDGRAGHSLKTGDFSALRRPLFWLMLAGFLAPAFFSGGYLLHMIILLHERGFSPEGAAQIQSLIGVAVLMGRLGSGWALDHFPPQWVAAIAFTISGLACVLLLQSDPILVGLAALGIGLTIGAELDIMAYFISRYFGLESFGRLYALAYACLITSSGASPVLISKVAGMGGGYDAALIVSTIGTVAGALILMTLPHPGRHAAVPATATPAAQA